MNLQEFIASLLPNLKMKTLLFLQLIPIIMSWIHGHHLQA